MEPQGRPCSTEGSLAGALETRGVPTSISMRALTSGAWLRVFVVVMVDRSGG